jgi:hypothetical protein
MEIIKIKGFRKPQHNSKLITDHSFTPIEASRIKYNKLREEQILFKQELSEKQEQFFNRLIKFFNN